MTSILNDFVHVSSYQVEDYRDGRQNAGWAREINIHVGRFTLRVLFPSFGFSLWRFDGGLAKQIARLNYPAT